MKRAARKSCQSVTSLLIHQHLNTPGTLPSFASLSLQAAALLAGRSQLRLPVSLREGLPGAPTGSALVCVSQLVMVTCVGLSRQWARVWVETGVNRVYCCLLLLHNLSSQVSLSHYSRPATLSTLALVCHAMSSE